MFPSKDYINNYFKRDISKVYFIGIGGVGLSSLANILLTLGYNVSGSDISIKNSDYIYQLKRKVIIYKNHLEENIKKFSPDLIIYTEAISKETNPEYSYGKNNQIPLISRSLLLNVLISKKKE